MGFYMLYDNHVLYTRNDSMHIKLYFRLKLAHKFEKYFGIMARTVVTPDSLLYVYLRNYDPEFYYPEPYLSYFGYNYHFHLFPTPSLIFHDACLGLLFRFLTDIPLQISFDADLFSSLMPEPDSESGWALESVPQAQDPHWYNMYMLSEYGGSASDDTRSDESVFGSVSGSTRTIASECESDETLPPDAELEYDIDIMSDGCVSEDIDTQADIFD